MNTLKLLTITLFLFLLHSTTTTAQTAVGLRLGYPLSITGKTFISDDHAIEAFVGYRSRNIFFDDGWRSLSINALYQIHDDLELGDLDGLRWFYGGGAGVRFWSYDDGLFSREDYSRISYTVMGVFGLNYFFEDTPINMSIDWVPRISVGRGYVSGFGAGYGAFSVRYVLGDY